VTTGERPVLPGLDDPLVRSVADRDHTPAELWVWRKGEGLRPLPITCERCRQEWPCATRLALRELSRKATEWLKS
jgi:hypothetical protein